MSHADTTAVNEDGRLQINKTVLEANGADPRHGEKYRLGLRAVNRAGLRSCGDVACSVVEGDRWAASQGVYFQIDEAGPICAQAKAWLCDPEASRAQSPDELATCHDISLFLRGGALSVADAGFQHSVDKLRVQWSGFNDGGIGSGIASG